MLLEATRKEKTGILDFDLHLDGVGIPFLNVPAGGSRHPATCESVQKRMHYVRQEGKKVYKYAVNGMSEVTARILAKNSLSAKDIDLFIFHQANMRIIKAVANTLGIDMEKVYLNISRYGNTTAASIPIALSEAYQLQRLRKDDTVLLAAFGAGFTWGGVLLKWMLD
jgi:3-oxoacyl-[acyl-carrier-protein] synthase-3